MKKCFKCGKLKQLKSFYKHPAMADGHLNKCKECTKADAKQHRTINIDYYLRYDRVRANLPHRVAARKAYQQTEAFKESSIKSKHKWQTNNPEKRRAHVMLNNAIRDGKIIKQKCMICGNVRTHGHHEDYDKPLVVKWLCIQCHVNEHKDKT